MESKNRYIWIIVFVIVVALCLCLLVLGLGLIAWFTTGTWSVGTLPGAREERIEQVFDLGREPGLQIDNFAGDITVRAGEGSTLQVMASKRASGSSNLERIEVNVVPAANGLSIRTRKPASLFNASVRLEITAPAGTRLQATTGAGRITVSGLQANTRVESGSGTIDLQEIGGDIYAHTGSGGIDIRGAAGDIQAETGSGGIDVSGVAGAVRLQTGSGSIDYAGRPRGDCHFQTGSGSIRLGLPADVQVTVDLTTSSGSIDVDFAVDGTQSRGAVRGKIGDGSQGSIRAHTGSGSIDVTRR
jgi:hypothetical protein